MSISEEDFLDALVAQRKKETDRILNTLYRKDPDSFGRTLNQLIELTFDAEQQEVLKSFYQRKPGVSNQVLIYHDIMDFISSNTDKLPFYWGVRDYLRAIFSFVRKVSKFLAEALQAFLTEDLRVSMLKRGIGALITLILIVSVIIGPLVGVTLWRKDQPLNEQAAELLRERGYHQAVLSDFVKHHICKGTEVVEGGIRQKTTYDGYYFEAYQDDEKIEGKVCPRPGIVSIK